MLDRMKFSPPGHNANPAKEEQSAFAGPSSPRPAVTADFYPVTTRQIVVCCGHEHGNPDFHSALDTLNTLLQLGLNDVDRHAFSYMLVELSNSRRFGGDVHIDPVQAENSAAHSCHAMVLANEIFRRAGLLGESFGEGRAEDLRIAITLGCLVHDMGEILGELSSLAQRAVHDHVSEMPDVEREIFRICLTEAYRSASSVPQSPAAFYEFVQAFREEAQIGPRGIAAADISNLARVISEHGERQRLSPLPAHIAPAVEVALQLYDLAELKAGHEGQRSRFIGNSVKVIEHLQGLRHFMRFTRRELKDSRLHLFAPKARPEDGPETEPAPGAIPFRYMSNYRLIQNAKYMERELPAIFAFASSDDERALAAATRDAVYLSQAEWFNIGRSFINRHASQQHGPSKILQEQFASADLPEERRKMLRAQIGATLRDQLVKDNEAHRRQENRVTEDPAHVIQLLPTETRSRLVQLYEEAVRIGFVPSSETPLMLLEEVPEPLRGFHSRSSPAASVASSPLEDLSMPQVPTQPPLT